MAIIENAGDKKICPICGGGLKKVATNKGKEFIKCEHNGMLEEGKPTTCEFVIDMQPKILEKETLSKNDAILLLNGHRVKKSSGEFYIDGKPKVIEGKKYYIHFEFEKAVVEDF